MNFFRIVILFFSLQVFVSNKDEVKAKLTEIIPKKLSIVSVDDTYSPNFFSVELSDGSLFFVTADGEFIINGDLYQIEKNSLINFSDIQDSKKRINRISEMNPQEFITFKSKDKKTEIYVFTDVDCGYCRKLHSEITSYLDKGIQVNYLAYPRAGIGSESFQKIASAWCNDDSNYSLTLLKQGKEIKKNLCEDNPVEKHFKLGNAIGVQGTPSIVTDEGKMIPGYLPPQDLLNILSSKS